MTQVSGIPGGGVTLSGSAPLAGSPPPAGTPVIVQAGTTVFNHGSLGPYTQVFPTPFPNGVLAVMVVNGDSDANSPRIGIGTGVPGSDFVTLSQFVCYASELGAYRFNWIAIGW